MKSKAKFLIILISISLIFSCTSDDLIIGNENYQNQIIEVPYFNKIKNESVVTLKIVQDSIQEVNVQANANIFPFLEIEVIDETLVVGLDEDNSYNNINVEVTISIPHLEALSLESSGDAFFMSDFTTQNLSIFSDATANVKSFGWLTCGTITLDQSGTTDFDLMIQSQLVNLYAEGATNTQLIGETDGMTINLKGSSKLKAHSCNSNHIFINHESTGNAEVIANTTLQGYLKSTGDIIYIGEGLESVVDTGTGDIIQL